MKLRKGAQKAAQEGDGESYYNKFVEAWKRLDAEKNVTQISGPQFSFTQNRRYIIRDIVGSLYSVERNRVVSSNGSSAFFTGAKGVGKTTTMNRLALLATLLCTKVIAAVTCYSTSLLLPSQSLLTVSKGRGIPGSISPI